MFLTEVLREKESEELMIAGKDVKRKRASLLCESGEFIPNLSKSFVEIVGILANDPFCVNAASTEAAFRARRLFNKEKCHD